MLFDKVVVFDNLMQKLILIVNIRLDDVDTEYARAKLELDNLIRLLRTGVPAPSRPGRLLSPFRLPKRGAALLPPLLAVCCRLCCFRSIPVHTPR